jgi:hypothetical protein
MSGFLAGRYWPLGGAALCFYVKAGRWRLRSGAVLLLFAQVMRWSFLLDTISPCAGGVSFLPQDLRQPLPPRTGAKKPPDI